VNRDKDLKSSRSPSLHRRLIWWFGIYVTGQLPLIPFAYTWGKGENTWIWVLFPNGMAWWLLMLTG
jgi:hypothetical protein